MSHVTRVVPVRFVSLLLLVISATCCWPASSLGDDVRKSSSLNFVPGNTAFYLSALRLREQYDALVNSKAFAAVMDMPAVKTGLPLLQDPDVPQTRRGRPFGARFS